jgi:hypothetical protein
MLFYRKKLSPLKKKSASQTKAVQHSSRKKLTKATFLNIEKLELVTLFSKIASRKDKEEIESPEISYYSVKDYSNRS